MPWITYDQQGRIAGVTQHPVAGAVEVAVVDAVQRDLDFAARRLEKFNAKPREQRAAIVLAEPAVQLAMLDKESPIPQVRASAEEVLSLARARIG